MKSMKERLEDAEKVKGQQPQRFTTFMARLSKAVDYITLRELVFAIKKEEKELGNGQFMFSKEDSDTFWAEYNTKKAEFYPQHEERRAAAIKEVEELIRTSSDTRELKTIKQEIYNTPVLDSKAITAPLYQLADERIAALAA